MNYVISDIHGCYKQYKELLEKISFSDEDTLYVLGDSVDRGPEPIKVLDDLMARKNVVYIVGNHDVNMLRVMKMKRKKKMSKDEQLEYQEWRSDGGMITEEWLLTLSEEHRQKIYEYLENALLYEELVIEGKTFVLVHAGIQNFNPEKKMNEYELYELVEGRTNYSKRYFSDENTYLVTGHTPTFFIRGYGKAEVYKNNGHIAVDCGCAYGGKLAAYCLETGEVFYVK